MHQNLYVYFKLAEQPRAELIAALQAMQGELAAQTGVRARLMRRRDDIDTWMEVYEGIADATAFSALLQAGLGKFGLDSYALARHEEWFVPLE
jgi:hypothetical protein